jgi:hypothetical protein
MVALDINHDGVDDLAVSAPAQGDGGVANLTDYYTKTYYGRVYVYLGVKGMGIV